MRTGIGSQRSEASLRAAAPVRWHVAVQSSSRCCSPHRVTRGAPEHLWENPRPFWLFISTFSSSARHDNAAVLELRSRRVPPVCVALATTLVLGLLPHQPDLAWPRWFAPPCCVSSLYRTFCMQPCCMPSVLGGLFLLATLTPRPIAPLRRGSYLPVSTAMYWHSQHHLAGAFGVPLADWASHPVAGASGRHTASGR
jgi:hypothetical protein